MDFLQNIIGIIAVLFTVIAYYQDNRKKFLIINTIAVLTFGLSLILKGGFIGGTWGSCWNDQLTPISPEPAPTSFYEFDEFLGDIVPDIKFMQYKAIEGRFISSDEDSDSDYYGGVQYSAYFTADIRGVLDYLIEHDIISVDELKAKM